LPRVVRWAGEIGVVLLAYLAISYYQTRRSLPEGSAFPELDLLTLDGREVSVEHYRGKALLVHVWAPWCAVCRSEVSTLNALAADPPADTAVVSLVAGEQSRPRLRQFIQDHEIHYPVWVVDDDTVNRLGIAAYPTNYYVAADGTVRAVTAGMSLRWTMWLRLWWTA
jgi:thiol-disulfide isomerase/thioredoxin